MSRKSPTDKATDAGAGIAVPEPGDDAVELVAKALADLAGVEGWNWYADEDGEAQFPGWNDLSDDDEYMGYEAEWPNHGRNHYRKQARAALAALQETHFIQTFDEAEHGARDTFNGGYELGREHEAAAVEPDPGLDAVEWEEIHVSKGDDGTGVVIEVEGVPDSRGRHVVIATGATLGEAIAAAVRQAKENGDG